MKFIKRSLISLLTAGIMLLPSAVIYAEGNDISQDSLLAQTRSSDLRLYDTVTTVQAHVNHGWTSFAITYNWGETYQSMGGVTRFSHRNFYIGVEASRPSSDVPYNFIYTPPEHYNSSGTKINSFAWTTNQSIIPAGLWWWTSKENSTAVTYTSNCGNYSRLFFGITGGTVPYSKEVKLYLNA